MSTTIHTHTRQTSDDLNQHASGQSTPRPRRNRHKPKPANDSAQLTEQAPPDRGRGRGGVRGRGRGRGGGRPPGDQRAHESTAESEDASSTGASSRPARGGGGRRAKFSSHLTDAAGPSAQVLGAAPRAERAAYTHPALVAGDLTSTLIDSLRTPPYPDCPICFSAIHPAQPSWSCSPTAPVAPVDGEEVESGPESARCCWTTFHLKCIRAWAGKSVKDVADAWRARGENRSGDWRCPGCQAKRISVPSGYWCFCGLVVDPKPPRLATPHSCASPCSRTRICGHPCPLPCHPGPCPPCGVTTSVPCHCGKETRSFRCSNLAPLRGQQARPEMSCGHPCGKLLGCGNHKCAKTCHPGECGPCEVMVPSRCWCGKHERELGCGKGEPRLCTIITPAGEREQWTGRFECAATCERPFDCGVHQCSKSCHVPSPVPETCPRSPSILTHCPCGKHTISPSTADFFPPNARLSRTKCTDPVPTCTSTCMKPLAGCPHVCSSPCHQGPCPPCSMSIVRPCRCGNITRTVLCSQFRAEEDVMCDKPCPALRACGRHRCNRLCCPLAALAGPSKKKGKKAGPAIALPDGDDETGLHVCDLVCGKTLSCGNHTCEEQDHRGACPPCLRSSFDEMVCHCGRTVLMPPIPCGTRLRCAHPCTRPPPACGHSRTPHACHDDATACPPCPFLTSKQCACGKKAVGNVRCSQEKVSCGISCGKLLACGFHKCTRLCHGDSCGPCANTCGKPRKNCLPELHPCTQPCHAPSSCPELEPCMATVTLTCPCGRIKQASPCGRSATNPLGRAGAAAANIKCSNECAIAKRNARLAEALGISADRQEGKSVNYADDLMAFARANQKFCLLAEKTFADFVTSDKKTHVLPHMPPERRKFIQDLAAVYRMDVQMVDQEPQRSVQLIRRIDTRIPPSLLSTACGAPLPGPGFGKLTTNLRGASVAKPALGSAPSAAGRGWTAVVSRPAPPAPAATQSTSSTWSRPVSASAARPAPVAPKPAPSTSASVQSTPVVPTAELGDVPDSWEDDL